MARAGLTSTAVVRAAADLADVSGLAVVSVSEVARILGVRPASLYVHVRDRAALLDGVHELALAELGDRIGRALAGRAGIDALRAFADTHRNLATEHPGWWQALQQPAADSVAASAAATGVGELSLAMLRSYGLPDSEAVHAVRLVASAVNGFVSLESSGAFGRRSPTADLSWQRVINALDIALREWPGQ